MSGLHIEFKRFFIAEFGLTKKTQFIEWIHEVFTWNIMKPLPPMNIIAIQEVSEYPEYQPIEYYSLEPKAYAHYLHGRYLAAYDKNTDTLYYRRMR